MKEYTCVQVGRHKNVGKKIEEWQKNGWHLHTYTCSNASRIGNSPLLAV